MAAVAAPSISYEGPTLTLSDGLDLYSYVLLLELLFDLLPLS